MMTKTQFLLGQKVRCHGYIKKSGNHFETDDPTGKNQISCTYWQAGASEGEIVDDFRSCDRFVTVEADFEGVFVGTTWRNTMLTAEWQTPPYTAEYIGFYTEKPTPFGVVYYAYNKKRLVPMDMMEVDDEQA